MNIFLAFNQREAYSCVFAFDNFHSLITLRIGMNYLSQSNSFLPLKAVVLFFITWSCYLLQASFGIHATPQWTGSGHEAIRKLQRAKKKNTFVFFSLNEMNQFNQEFWQAQAAINGEEQWYATLSCSSEVSHWGHMKLYFPGFLLNILVFIYPRIRPLWPYNTRTYITWIFFGIQSGSS